MKITWIGQSGYQLKSGSGEIIIDPYLSDVVERVAGRARMVAAPIEPANICADAVICTHDHLDHLDPDAIADMPENTVFYTTPEGTEKIISLGKKNVHALKQGDSVQIGDFRITAVFADHTVEAMGLIVEAEGFRLYFSGDTLFNEKLFEISAFEPDAAFLCINGKLGNMDTDEAIQVARNIGAKINVPNHYGMFASNTADPEVFTAAIENGRIMEMGKVYEFDKLLSGI